MLRLAGCQYADDWMMGRIGTMFSQSLEMLDLSDCDRITAKGLAGLRSLKKLRYLRLEGMDHIKVCVYSWASDASNLYFPSKKIFFLSVFYDCFSHFCQWWHIINFNSMHLRISFLSVWIYCNHRCRDDAKVTDLYCSLKRDILVTSIYIYIFSYNLRIGDFFFEQVQYLSA